MSLSDYLLSTLGLYGPSVLFVVLLVGAIGLPSPGSLLLLVAGSFVEQGEMSLWQVLALACAGSVIGDQIGYALGRWGGRRVTSRLERWFGVAEAISAGRFRSELTDPDVLEMPEWRRRHLP